MLVPLGKLGELPGPVFPDTFTLAGTERLLHRFGDIPSMPQALSEPLRIDTVLLSNFSGAKSFSFVHIQRVLPSVSVLGGAGSPYAIVRAVVTIIVFPLNGMKRAWPWPHIRQKLTKPPALRARLPFFADGNTATRIAWMGFAPPAHISPNRVFCVLGFGVSVPMPAILKSASAAAGRLKVGKPLYNYSAAHAFKPSRPSVLHRENDCKVPNFGRYSASRLAHRQSYATGGIWGQV